MSDLLKKIYSAFDPAPLRDAAAGLYVELDDVRGHSSIVSALRSKIILAEGNTCQALTGHRGSGKSTELWRLRHALEKPADNEDGRYFVVQIQAEEELDCNDIDFPELLFAIIRQLAEQLRVREKIELKPGYFASLWNSVKDVALKDVDLDNVEFSVGMVKISGALRHSSVLRQQLRTALDPQSTNWLKAANDIIGDALLKLKRKNYRGLVIIVDDLDKMTTRELPSAGCLTTENLFIRRASQMSGLGCHVIYTLPIDLAYSHHSPTLKRLYSGHLPVVPMIKLRTPPPKRKTHPEGMASFRKVIAKRLQSVGATEKQVFKSDKVRDDLIKLSGGQPSELMTLIRESLIAGLPIDAKGLHRAFQENVRSYARWLRGHHWPVIESIGACGRPTGDQKEETALRQLLESRAVLVYRNDDEWYDLNPAVEKITPPASGRDEA